MAAFDARGNGADRVAGEFELIARLTGGIESRPDVALGIGDDAALLDFGADSLLVATVDAQVAGRHFVLGIATPEEVGHKSLAVNLSDIAAMGGEPLWALVSLLVPPALESAVLDRVYAGLRALARRCGVAIVGGNVAATSGPLTLDVVLLGRAARGRALTRSGGRPGDLVLVTGELGAAAAGVLALVTQPRAGLLAPDILARVRRAMAAPEPRVGIGRALAASGAATAMLDISDGLASDLWHLCARSDVGAVIDAADIPISLDARAVCSVYGRDAVELALTGGEDYELLFAVPPARRDDALAAVGAAGGTARVIGELTADAGSLLLRRPGGALEPLPADGWDHLRFRAAESDT